MTDTAPWWQAATGYQIYPRSFCDSDGDGIGDIPGIISKLDHLADLGVGFVWLSPVYRSPMVDNGYDISDYRDIAPEFGTLHDMDRLIAEARARGIGIVMDLVVNHSSDEHHWFQSARRDRQSPYRDFYVWRDPAAGGGPPNELQSNFGGPAWSFDEVAGQYYLHLFDRKQPDLNWQNPALRREIYEMMNWWLDRGVAGFRMDVIDLIGKQPDRGITADGPDLHPFLREMHAQTLAGRDVVTVGEAWSATPAGARLYSGREARELSMVFQFEHVTQGWHEVHGKWRPKPFDLVALKAVLDKWQIALAEDGWNSLFWGNHDLPRAVSRYGDDGRFRVRSAKLLATALHLMKGTPYIYQGEEIGMTNAAFSDISQFRDVETLNFHAIQTAAGVAAAEFMAGANANGRDNARTPMQWTDGPQAGFTDGRPWIEVNPNHAEINVARDRADPDGVFAHYRALAALRRELAVVRHGTYRPHLQDHPQVMAYERWLDDERIVMVANFSGRPAEFDLPAALQVAGRCVSASLAPRTSLSGRVTLEPWEAVAIHATG
ncbi:glycoside hydrolase family 13 protein [Limimaricola pyoseonensis]|uniref:Oligo-1,6-glucosidase n=1 Tax=Limimaricola pyoseonensis TaxID=521013 RepID=A0A1G7DEJ2_9RHOB|nr:alpha-glucosidase [Limimaricola pyoseonensis]SDE49941.1 oligo-1,6-glucosidase [Limimaricola pyoseonensis]